MSKLTTRVQGRTLLIQLNRPQVRNCVDAETAELLGLAWRRFRDDPELWVAVLTGSGERAFCSGADLSAAQEMGPGADARPSQWRHWLSHGPGYLGQTRMTDIYKPIIAAINGDALAGGLELACLADMRVVEEHARFGVACRRWNVPLCDGGTQRLPRIIGMGRAMEMILTGRMVDAREAHLFGLANEVVPTGQSLERALTLAQQLCAFPQGAMRTDKQAAVMGWGRPLEEGLRIEGELARWSLFGADMEEGRRAFQEKRLPKFPQDD
jgi:enoyl-CoA hydratase